MTGFLESEDDGKRTLYYKSPLINEPVSKINWSELIEETKKFVGENWSDISDEYIKRSCGSIKVVDPFSGDNVELGERAETALEVSSADYPDVFKSAKDAEIKDYESFLTKAEGDYTDEEEEAVRQYFEKD
tara:strand:- start:385 stop:777 length:393 start_codon:yes stop_codon:yes gene_type:complete